LKKGLSLIKKNNDFGERKGERQTDRKRGRDRDTETKSSKRTTEQMNR